MDYSDIFCHNSSDTDVLHCVECKAVVDSLVVMSKSNLTVSEIETIAIDFCIVDNLFPPDVCEGMVKMSSVSYTTKFAGRCDTLYIRLHLLVLSFECQVSMKYCRLKKDISDAVILAYYAPYELDRCDIIFIIIYRKKSCTF